MTITIHLAPDEETRLRQKAAEQGQDIGEYVRAVVRQQAAPPQRAIPEKATHTQAYDPDAAIALLEEFAASDTWGSAEEQRDTFGFLEKAIDEDRPGQRSIFGKGINPT